jgi:hypothetical protein
MSEKSCEILSSQQVHGLLAEFSYTSERVVARKSLAEAAYQLSDGRLLIVYDDRGVLWPSRPAFEALSAKLEEEARRPPAHMLHSSSGRFPQGKDFLLHVPELIDK